MNDALHAVRFAEKNAFRGCPRASAFTQRSVLRHLCDVARPACEVTAYLDGHKAAKCVHAGCAWVCFQTDVETSADLSLSEDGVKRAREALVSEGWIKAGKTSSGRGAVWVYTIAREALEKARRPKKDGREAVGKRVAATLQSELTKIGSLPTLVSDEESAKVGSLPIFNEPEIAGNDDKGRQTAEERVADCLTKVGRLPLTVLKNPIEPKENLSMPLRGVGNGSAGATPKEKTYTVQHVVMTTLIATVKEIGTALPKWDTDAVGRLADLLRKVEQPLEFWKRCITNWRNSDRKYHSPRTYLVLIGSLVEFQNGSKDGFGKVILPNPAGTLDGLPLASGDGRRPPRAGVGVYAGGQ